MSSLGFVAQNLCVANMIVLYGILDTILGIA